jgi:hypothetical protein
MKTPFQLLNNFLQSRVYRDGAALTRAAIPEVNFAVF